MSTQREILRNLTKANSPNRSGSNKDRTSNLNFQFPQSIKPRNHLELMKNIFFITIIPRLPDGFWRMKVGILLESIKGDFKKNRAHSRQNYQTFIQDSISYRPQ